MKKTLITLTILIGFIFAEDPTLNVQGVLRDADGASVPDGENYQLTFHLYDVVDGGSSLWSEDHTGVSVINGVYSVELGGVSSLGGLAFATPYYLGIAVNGGAESTPRIPLSMSPYALSVRGTSNVFPNDGPVGIGTTDPTGGGLDVHSYTGGEWGGWRNTINLSTPSDAGIFYHPGGLMMGFHSNRNIYFGDTQNEEYRMTLTEANVTVTKDLVVAGETHLNNYYHFENTNELNTDGTMYLNHNGNDVDISHGGGLTTTGGNLNVDGGLQVGGDLQVGGGSLLGCIQTGSIGDGTPSSAGYYGTVTFPTSFSSPPRVFLQTCEFDNAGVTSARIIDVTATGFSWNSWVGGSHQYADQIWWLAIGN